MCNLVEIITCGHALELPDLDLRVKPLKLNESMSAGKNSSAKIEQNKNKSLVN